MKEANLINLELCTCPEPMCPSKYVIDSKMTGKREISSTSKRGERIWKAYTALGYFSKKSFRNLSSSLTVSALANDAKNDVGTVHTKQSPVVSPNDVSFPDCKSLCVLPQFSHRTENKKE